MRMYAVDVLGNVCCRCGFEDARALQIDHINGGGVQELRSISYYKLYKWIIENCDDAREKYQILCANCNWIKRHENDEVMQRRNPLIEPKILKLSNGELVNVYDIIIQKDE